MMFSLVWRVVPFLMQLAFFAYYVVSAAYVASMGKSQFYNNATNTTDDGGVTYYLKRAPCDEAVSCFCYFENSSFSTFNYLYLLIK